MDVAEFSSSWKKRAEGYRSPRRAAMIETGGKSARSWNAPVLWRFGSGRGTDSGRGLATASLRSSGKGPGDYRGPRRFATTHAN